MSVVKDEYILGKSMVKSLSGVGEAIRIDLRLNSNPHLQSGTFTGKIKDNLGKPVADAVIIVLDESYEMLANAISSNGGTFLITPLKSGKSYHAYAHAPGFSLADTPCFTLRPNETVERDFMLTPNSEDYKPIIIGVVQNQLGLPINLASIELCRLEGTSAKLIGISLSNEVGQFILRDLMPGIYFLKVNAMGYFDGFYPIEIGPASGITRVEAILKENPKSSKGMITGLITDTEDQPLVNADVILYREESDQSLLPVSYTRTNHEGIYLFVNVPHGNYRINANRSVTLN